MSPDPKSGTYIFAHCRIMAERDEVGQVSLISFAATDLTEQKRTENQLARVFAATRDGWWEWDVVKDIVYRSPRWREMFGFAPDDPRTAYMSGLLTHPDDIGALRLARKRAVETGQQLFECEWRHLKADGTYMPILSRQIFERDAAGTIVRISGAITDLSKLRGAEEQLKRVIGASADGWSEWDSERDKTERSPRWYEMFGYAPGADSGREADSDFELHVMEQLRSIGCEVVPQVGVEGYFIDIGVKHAQWPHGFILGVECDGATYHSSKSARDRDRLRQEVLEGLGWTLYRVWSTDWFNDPRSETAKLKTVIEARLKQLQDAIIEMPPNFLEKKVPAKSADQTEVKIEMGGLSDSIAGATHPR